MGGSINKLFSRAMHRVRMIRRPRMVYGNGSRWSRSNPYTSLLTLHELSRHDIFLCSSTDETLRLKICNNLTVRGYTVFSPHASEDDYKRSIDKTGTCIIAILHTNDQYSFRYTNQLQYAFKCQIPVLLINTESQFTPTTDWLKIIMDNVMAPIKFTPDNFEQSFSTLLETIQKITDGLISPFHQDIKSIDSNEVTRSNRFIGYTAEWTVVFQYAAFKSNQFRKLLNNPAHIQSNKSLYNILYQHYDVNLPREIKKILKSKFSQAVENNDARYLIDVYTGTTGFSRVLNEHLAIYGLHFFDRNLQQNVNYQLVKCLMDFVALLYFRPEFDGYSLKGEVYRGMCFSNKDELYKYIVGSKVMNTTFLSTSKTENIAQLFSPTTKQQEKDTDELSVFCTYVIVNDRTALNIEELSVFPAEQEVIIMPFSAFRVEKVTRNNQQRSNVEITLTECPKQDIDNFDDDDDDDNDSSF